ncbi:MAG: M48 family metallopeptidase [Clostridiales bacterium]|nr:M48 family metallopeptidase [Clostridiales bacterium]
MVNEIVGGMGIQVIKKNIKNMHLSVLPPNGIVRVSVPLSVDDDAIRLFIVSKIGWIKKQKERFKNQARQSERRFIDGESVYVWGNRYRLVIKHGSKKNRVEIKGDRLYLYVREKSTVKQREAALNKWYRELLKKEITKFVEIWQRRIGIKVDSCRVKNMKTRWGTCNTVDKRIWINLQLAKKPLSCLEYIVLHELTHLLEESHNEVFVAYMDKFMPDWRMRKSILNEYILDYMYENKLDYE